MGTLPVMANICLSLIRNVPCQMAAGIGVSARRGIPNGRRVTARKSRVTLHIHLPGVIRRRFG